MITLQIKTHDGEVFIVEVDEYNAQEINDKINDSSLLTIVLGDRIISRIKIAEISVVDINEEQL